VSSPFTVGQELYRLVDETRASGGYNMHGEWEPSPFGPAIVIRWEIWVVRRLTPKGAWISMGNPAFQSMEEWVGKSSRKFFPTRMEAKAGAIQRRSWNIKMMKKRLLTAERRLRQIEETEIPDERS
jgi:hypothetical protein